MQTLGGICERCLNGRAPPTQKVHIQNITYRSYFGLGFVFQLLHVNNHKDRNLVSQVYLNFLETDSLIEDQFKKKKILVGCGNGPVVKRFAGGPEFESPESMGVGCSPESVIPAHLQGDGGREGTSEAGGLAWSTQQ